MAAEKQGQDAGGEQEGVPAPPRVVAAGDGVEDEGQQRRRIRQWPAEPEQEEAAEAEGEGAGERGAFSQTLPAHPEEAEDQRQQHPQRRHDPGSPQQRER